MSVASTAEQVLAELQYDFRSFTIGDFVSHIGQARGRAIITIPWRMPPALFGAWMSDADEPKEYIFYREDVPAIHQIHIQLHELSHLLLGHPTLQINRIMIARVLEGEAHLPFADLPRLRSPQKDELEFQAETLAGLIQKVVIQKASLDRLVNDLSSEVKLAHFLQTMGLA
ncbi:MAG: hypothetical protein HYR70_00410 [Chloroflexi bacterium]|nr:hypothetical protein [Chloroflexota bacterium]